MAKGWGRPKPGALNSASHVGGGNPSTWIINYCDGFYFMRQIKNVWASWKYVPAILITCLQKVFHILCGRLKLGIGLFLLYFAQVCLHAMSKFFSIHVGLFIRGKGGRRWNRREHTNTLPANPQEREMFPSAGSVPIWLGLKIGFRNLNAGLHVSAGTWTPELVVLPPNSCISRKLKIQSLALMQGFWCGPRVIVH